jgi:hypothetical protein
MHLWQRACFTALPLILAGAYAGYAQPVQPPTRAEAEAALNPTPPQFTAAQLDQILAPIALYPDQLLTEVLMAATFPEQLVDAAKWLQDSSNAALKGDDLANALQPLPWDPSVKSLVAFPQLIAMMTDHLDWTEALGTAFGNQEVETFARVQFLRERAKQSGLLKSTTQLAVREEASDIIIEPTDSNMIYVPVYNPAVVYGTWPDSDAPPVYIPPPPGFYNGALGAGIGFSIGFGVVAPLWGWGHPDWRNHDVVVDPTRYQHITNQTNITQNHITIENQVWHRTGPIAQVPEAQRPHPPEEHGQLPPGTVRPGEFAHPTPAPGAPGAPPHPGEAQPARPGEPPHPGQEPPHPGQPPHAPEAQPGLHPGEQPPPGQPPRSNEAQPARPGEPIPPGHPERPAEPPRPPEAQPNHPERPGEPPHPPEAPHPAGPPPQAHPAPPPQAAHPPGPPPAAHPTEPPAKKPPPKPGEEDKDKPDQH